MECGLCWARVPVHPTCGFGESFGDNASGEQPREPRAPREPREPRAEGEARPEGGRGRSRGGRGRYGRGRGGEGRGDRPPREGAETRPPREGGESAPREDRQERAQGAAESVPVAASESASTIKVVRHTARASNQDAAPKAPPVPKDYEVVNAPPTEKKKGWWNKLVES